MRDLASRDLDKYYGLEKSVTIKDCLIRPSISELINLFDVSRADIASAIDWQVEILTMTLNIGNNLNTFQKKDLVYNFLDKYSHETLEDFVLCFKMAKDGQFGIIYNRIDREVINTWMQKYLEIKAIEREAYTASSKKENQLKDMTQDEIRQWYSNGIENMKNLEKVHKRIDHEESQKIESDHKAASDYAEFRKRYIAKSSNHLREQVEGNESRGTETNVPIPDGGTIEESNPVSSKRSKHSK
jgi:hypothetical protein